MHQVSDGQRRRVQLVVGLLRPFKVLLLDEVTVDLDVLGRAELMRFLREECEGPRKAAVVYCTHIFEGLESWPTHVAYVAGGEMRALAEAASVPELNNTSAAAASGSMLALSSSAGALMGGGKGNGGGEGSSGLGKHSGLLGLVLRLLESEQDPNRPKRTVEWDPSREGQVAEGFSYAFNNGWVPGTMSSSLSTNAVMRQ
jgi:CCR4-NOT complex subunit CAF16